MVTENNNGAPSQKVLGSLIKEVLNSSQRKYDHDNADDYILRCKNAEVLWYQPIKLIACVRFLEDKNKNEYHLYNRCHEYLAPGDQVKVYYTKNVAKGWIAVRNGVPNFMNEYGQFVNDIPDCCDDDDNGDNCCCDTTCCSEAATRQQARDTEVVEEWDERIEGAEEDIREYEQNESQNSPFYKFDDTNR